MIDTLARLLFPRANWRLRRRKMRALGLGILLGSLVSCLVGLLLWQMSRPTPMTTRELPPRGRAVGPLAPSGR